MSEKKIHAEPFRNSETNAGGSWSIDAELGLLTDESGIEKRLEPRLSKLMFLLLSNLGKFVSRRELIDEMWPDTVVTEQSLTRAVADLRKFLRLNYRVPPVIETASKQGYRMSYAALDEMSDSATGSSFWKVLRLIGYGFVALVLLVLIVRGLNY